MKMILKQNIPCDPRYLESKLKEVYKRFFPFGTMAKLNRYFRHDGVIADFDLEGNPIYKTTVLLNPLRIEVHHIPTASTVVAWQMPATSA